MKTSYHFGGFGTIKEKNIHCRKNWQKHANKLEKILRRCQNDPAIEPAINLSLTNKRLPKNKKLMVIDIDTPLNTSEQENAKKLAVSIIKKFDFDNMKPYVEINPKLNRFHIYCFTHQNQINNFKSKIKSN